MHINKEIGIGSQYIYAYHFPSEYVHNGEYPIKVGHATKNPVKRIKEQQASMKEQPVIDLLIHCDNSRYVEKVIHNRLQLSKLASFGKEWFRTTPEEILDIWWTIQDTHNLSISEQIRFFRTAQKLTQTDLAEAAGTRQEVISKAETSPETMSFQTIDNIAKELGLRIVLTPN
jgi:DNA-binding XRE family transcriptional regulator